MMEAGAPGSGPEALPPKRGSDAALLELPVPPFTPLTLFVCTYVATLQNLRIGFEALTHVLCDRPQGVLLAVNSNFGHAAQPGFEALIKTPRPPPVRAGPTRGKVRRVQGDGSCFNSAVEPVVAPPPDMGLPHGKVYFVKCFPTTGQMQVPGVIRPDLADGDAVLDAFVAYLNGKNVGVLGPEGVPLPVKVKERAAKMLNYKFQLVRASSRLLVNLAALAARLRALEGARATEGGVGALPPALTEWRACVLPPYVVRETKAPADDVKISFRFVVGERRPRVNVFQMGKVNILGGDSEKSAERIFAFFGRLFSANWQELVCLQPLSDAEKFAPRVPRLLPPPPRAAFTPAALAAASAALAELLGSAPPSDEKEAEREERGGAGPAGAPAGEEPPDSDGGELSSEGEPPDEEELDEEFVAMLNRAMAASGLGPRSAGDPTHTTPLWPK